MSQQCSGFEPFLGKATRDVVFLQPTAHFTRVVLLHAAIYDLQKSLCAVEIGGLEQGGNRVPFQVPILHQCFRLEMTLAHLGELRQWALEGFDAVAPFPANVRVVWEPGKVQV
uniref:(northern house mosquito) hypothetical protein n=1 Tax=Culex pipiens TaxID=7175 RepID=A0A8D8FYQ1_CULPI